MVQFCVNFVSFRVLRIFTLPLLMQITMANNDLKTPNQQQDSNVDSEVLVVGGGQLLSLKCHGCVSLDCPLIQRNLSDCLEIREGIVQLLLQPTTTTTTTNTAKYNRTIPDCPQSDPRDDMGWLRLALTQAHLDCNREKSGGLVRYRECGLCGRVRVKGFLLNEGGEPDDLIPDEIVFARVLTCLSPADVRALERAEGGCRQWTLLIADQLKITAEQCLEKDTCTHDYCTRGWGLSSRYPAFTGQTGPGQQKILPTILLIVILVAIIFGAIFTFCGSLLYKAQAAR